MSKELKDGVAFSIETKGIAYTYSSTGKEKDRVLLNPDWVILHSEPMCIIDINDAIVSIKGQPLVFKNRITAEGALMTLQVMHPEETASLIIDKYSKDRAVAELKVGE